MDGAGDKTQLVDSASVLGNGVPGPVLFDDSSTGKNDNPLRDNTGRTEYPPDDDSATLDGNSNPFATSEATMAAPLPTGSASAVRKGKTPAKAQVVIGEGEQENYAGATQIGPPPSSRGRDTPQPEEEEDDSTKDVRGLSSRGGKSRAQKSAREEELEDQGETSDEEAQETGKAAVPARKPTGPAIKAAKDKKPAATGPRKPVNPKVFIFAGAGVLVLGIIATVIALASGGDTGSIMFTVEPATNAVIRVDNQPVAPNTVIELEAGQHKVIAAADGFELLEKTFTITPGQKPQPMPLKLVRSGGGEPPPDKEPDETAQAPDKPETPTKEPDEQVAKNPDTGKDPAPPKPATPEPAKTFVAVFVGEDGAEIKVDGKSAGQTPNAKLANLSIGKTYKFVASRAGYKPYAGEFKSDGDSELTVKFSLEKEAPKPVEVAKPPPQPKPVETAKPPPQPKPAVSKVMGKLAASTKPAGAQIWVDGKYTGRDTPVAIGNPLLLPVGTRKVFFKLGNKQTKPQTVNITEADVAKLIGVPIE